MLAKYCANIVIINQILHEFAGVISRLSTSNEVPGRVWCVHCLCQHIIDVRHQFNLHHCSLVGRLTHIDLWQIFRWLKVMVFKCSQTIGATNYIVSAPPKQSALIPMFCHDPSISDSRSTLPPRHIVDLANLGLTSAMWQPIAVDVGPMSKFSP